MGLTMLPIARESPWLNAAGVAFPDGIPFHRVTGWWCVAQVVLHAVAEVAAVMAESSSGAERTHHGPANASHWEYAWGAVPVFLFPWVERLDDVTGTKELNSEGLVNFCGVLGLVAAVVMAVFATPWVRRRFYHWFYNVHLPAGLFFVAMAVFHNFPMQMFVVPGGYNCTPVHLPADCGTREDRGGRERGSERERAREREGRWGDTTRCLSDCWELSMAYPP